MLLTNDSLWAGQLARLAAQLLVEPKNQVAVPVAATVSESGFFSGGGGCGCQTLWSQ